MKNTPTHRINTLGGLAALLAALAMTFVAAPAWACGGFFCFTQPIDQSAERILYIQEDGKMTAHIQISYTGDDDKFSWVLPLLGVPELGIGSDSIFQQLEQGTNPRFSLQWKNDKDCQGVSPCMMMAAGGGGPPNAENKGGGGVEVLQEQNVGPYKSVVIKGDNALAVIDWLTEHGYTQPPETEPLIAHYIKEKYVFLALQLLKDSGAGDIAPIVVSIDDVPPCLPIRLTSIATQPDMPIVAWSLGKARAIPKNFLHVILNDATIDWLKPGTNYKTVVSQAVDQASGHAFTTEYAQPTKNYKSKFYQDQWKTDELKAAKTPTEFMTMMLQKSYPRTTQMQNLIRKHIPKPKAYESVKDNAFYNCIGCSGCKHSPCSEYKAEVAKQKFDAAAFADDVKTYVVEPLKQMQGHMETLPYLTRLYTTLSASEMTKDPIFAFNPDLPDVSNIHKATAVPICEGESKQASKARLEFGNGSKLVVDIPKSFQDCGLDAGSGAVAFGQGKEKANAAGGQPAWEVQVLDESGPPIVIDPREADLVDAELNKAKAGTPSLSKDFIAALAKPTWDPTKKEQPPLKGGTATTGSGTTGSGTDATSAGPVTVPAGGGSSSGCQAQPGDGAMGGTAALCLFALSLLFGIRRRQRQSV